MSLRKKFLPIALAAASLFPTATLAAQPAPQPPIIRIYSVDETAFKTNPSAAMRDAKAPIELRTGTKANGTIDLGTHAVQLKKGQLAYVTARDGTYKTTLPADRNDTDAIAFGQDYLINESEVRQSLGRLPLNYEVTRDGNCNTCAPEKYRFRLNVSMLPDGHTAPAPRPAAAPKRAAQKDCVGSGCTSHTKTITLPDQTIDPTHILVHKADGTTLDTILKLPYSRNAVPTINLDKDGKVAGYSLCPGDWLEIIPAKGQHLKTFAPANRNVERVRNILSDNKVTFDEVADYTAASNKGHLQAVLNTIMQPPGVDPSKCPSTRDEFFVSLRPYCDGTSTTPGRKTPGREIDTPADVPTSPTGKITFKKIVRGGKASPADWRHTANDITLRFGENELPEGSYEYTESDGPENYKVTKFSKDCAGGKFTIRADKPITCEVTNEYMGPRPIFEFDLLGSSGTTQMTNTVFPAGFGFDHSGVLGQITYRAPDFKVFLNGSHRKGDDAGQARGGYAGFFADHIKGNSVAAGFKATPLKFPGGIKLGFGAGFEYKDIRTGNLPEGETSNINSGELEGNAFVGKGDFNGSHVIVGVGTSVQNVNEKLQSYQPGQVYNASNHREMMHRIFAEGRWKGGPNDRLTADFSAYFAPWIKTISSSNGVRLGDNPTASAVTVMGYYDISPKGGNEFAIGGGMKWAGNKQSFYGPIGSGWGLLEKSTINQPEWRYGIRWTIK